LVLHSIAQKTFKNTPKNDSDKMPASPLPARDGGHFKKGTSLRTVPHTCVFFFKYNSFATEQSLLCQGRVSPSQEGDLRPETDRTAPCRTPL